MADETTIETSNDTFECSVCSDVRLSNDFREWPEVDRKCADAAVERLLAQHPGTKVISDTSECIDDTHPRFPVGDENKGKFFGVRTVKLDRPVTDLQEGEQRSGILDETPGAATRLRAFEDKHLGKDAVRIRGQIERGSGSPYQDPQIMPPELRRQHAALEKLIDAEQKLAAAHAALIQADLDHDAALDATEPKSDAVE